MVVQPGLVCTLLLYRPSQRNEVCPSLLDWVLGACVLEAVDPVDGPEVVGQGRVADVLVGHVEVTLVAPPD